MGRYRKGLNSLLLILYLSTLLTTLQIALLVSVIKASGAKVKWADVAVPAARTTQSAAKMYSEMMKASAGVAMTAGAGITPSKKRVRKNADDGATTPTEKKKRVRKPKVAARAATVSPIEDDEGEESPKKKVKVEPKGEDEGEDAMNGELDSQEEGLAT